MPKRASRPIFRVMDIGFGLGERLSRAKAKPNRLLEGVEKPSANRIQLKGKKLTYQGFERWLYEAKSNSYSLINADFVFNNYLHYLYQSVGWAEGSKRMDTVMKVICDRLVPGGKLTFRIPVETKGIKEGDLGRVVASMEKAGFSRGFIQIVDQSDQTTHGTRINQKVPDTSIIQVIATKPRFTRIFKVDSEGKTTVHPLP